MDTVNVLCFMAKGTLIDIEMGKIILDYLGEPNLITRVLNHGRRKRKRSE